VVEEARGPAVEGERRRRHLPELHPERGRVGGQELAEGGVEDGEDLLAAVLVAELRDRHRWVPPGAGSGDGRAVACLTCEGARECPAPRPEGTRGRAPGVSAGA